MKWLFQSKHIYLIAIIKFALPFLLQNSVYELHRDEYLYYAQGQHLDLGYMECPPMIGWMGYVSSLFGGGFFAVKFWSSFVGALTVILTAAIAKEMGGRLIAQVAACIGIMLGAYMRVHFLFQPNMLDIFFWSLAAYYLLRYINTLRDRYLYALAIALVLGWWGKYSVLFFIVAMLIGLVLTKHRNVFINFSFWKAVVLGLVLITPNLLWQWHYNFPLAHHMDELRQTQLKYINKGDFIKEQILMLLPVCFVWIGGLFWLLHNIKYRIIGLIYLGIIALLMFGNGKGYYALGAYPMLLAAGGVWMEKLQLRWKWLLPICAVPILGLFVVFVPVLLPMSSPEKMAANNEKYNLKELGILKWEDQQNHSIQQDFADMLGWKEMAQKTEHLFDSLTAMKYGNIIIRCDSYGEAGALQYYGKSDYFKQQVFSNNGSFVLWQPQRLFFEHIIRVTENMPDTIKLGSNHFKKVTIIDSVTTPHSRQDDIISFWEGADSVAVQNVRNKIEKTRKQFQR